MQGVWRETFHRQVTLRASMAGFIEARHQTIASREGIMREIKFRAWHKHHKFMFQVMEVTFDAQYDSGFSRVVAYPYDDWNRSENEQGEWANRAPRERTHYLHHEIDNLELMQYTGLKDKTGREIYEGDIVMCEGFDGSSKIEYEGCSFIGRYIRNFQWIDLEMRELEVIGNTYEHPELLQQAQN